MKKFLLHHFAHHDSSAELCEFALETSIRLMLLETLGQIQSISTPVFLWGTDTYDKNGLEFTAYSQSIVALAWKPLY
jgi:hypothetical protein